MTVFDMTKSLRFISWEWSSKLADFAASGTCHRHEDTAVLKHVCFRRCFTRRLVV